LLPISKRLVYEVSKKRCIDLSSVLRRLHCGNHSLLKDIKDFLPLLSTITSAFGEIRVLLSGVSQPPGRGPVPGPGINYAGPREVFLELVILVF